MPKKVLLVEDHPVTRLGLRSLINAAPDLRVESECDDYEDALASIGQHAPDIVVVDIGLGRADGLHLTHQIALRWPTIPVLVVSMHEEKVYASRALKAGAKGYVMKQEASDKIIVAIRAVLAGQLFISEKARSGLLKRTNAGSEAPMFGIDTLSNRQFEVLTRIGDGYSTREIAAQLGLSVKTIDTFREQLKEKLNFKDGTELVRHAIEWRRSVA